MCPSGCGHGRTVAQVTRKHSGSPLAAFRPRHWLELDIADLSPTMFYIDINPLQRGLITPYKAQRPTSPHLWFLPKP